MSRPRSPPAHPPHQGALLQGRLPRGRGVTSSSAQRPVCGVCAGTKIRLLLQGWRGLKMSGVPVNSLAMPRCGCNRADSSHTFSLGLGLLCSCGPALGVGGGCGQRCCSVWVPQMPKRQKPKRERSWGGGDVQRSHLRERLVSSLCCSARLGKEV